MCNAYKAAVEFARECKEPEERVMNSQRAEIAKLKDKNKELANRCNRWQDTATTAIWVAIIEAGLLLFAIFTETTGLI